MKKFKCTASKRGEHKSSKKIKEQIVYESRSFTFFAKNFNEALLSAEKIAKKMMVFESLKVSRA